MNEIDRKVQPSFDKKPYQEPCLQVYGDIQVLTRTNTHSPVNRDRTGGGSNNKTA
jgi:hypothetical protein